jgi:hypothetical protein
MTAGHAADSEPGPGRPADAAGRAQTQAASEAAPGQLSRARWITLWAVAIAGVAVVFLVVIALSNP